MLILGLAYGVLRAWPSFLLLSLVTHLLDGFINCFVTLV
jgi:hypothetical protein